MDFRESLKYIKDSPLSTHPHKCDVHEGIMQGLATIKLAYSSFTTIYYHLIQYLY